MTFPFLRAMSFFVGALFVAFAAMTAYHYMMPALAAMAFHAVLIVGGIVVGVWWLMKFDDGFRVSPVNQGIATFVGFVAFFVTLMRLTWLAGNQYDGFGAPIGPAAILPNVGISMMVSFGIGTMLLAVLAPLRFTFGSVLRRA